MIRRKPRFSSPPLARLCTLAGPARLAVHDAAGARVVAVPGRYSVSYLLDGPDGVAVVDVGSALDRRRILAALRWIGRAPGDVRCVVPSHLHFDHVVGVDRFARAVGAPVALGATAHAHVSAGRPLPFPGLLARWRPLATWPMQGAPLPAVVDLAGGLDFGFPWGRNRFRAPLLGPLADGDPLPGPAGWRVLATPGHAADAIALYHEDAGFLVPGDTIRNFYGGEWNPLVVDRAAMAATRARLEQLVVRAIFPGHGPVLAGANPLAALRTVLPGVP